MNFYKYIIALLFAGITFNAHAQTASSVNYYSSFSQSGDYSNNNNEQDIQGRQYIYEQYTTKNEYFSLSQATLQSSYSIESTSDFSGIPTPFQTQQEESIILLDFGDGYDNLRETPIADAWPLILCLCISYGIIARKKIDKKIN